MMKMRRCKKSVISPIFVLFVTFVMILDLVLSYETRHHNKNAVIEEDSDSNEVEINSSVFIKRLLKMSSSALGSTDEEHGFDEMNQFPHATFSEHSSKPNVHNHPSTSCGHITCVTVPNYPEDIIIEIAKSSNLIPESPKLKSMTRTNYPVARSLNHEYSTDRSLQRTPEGVKDCSKLVREIVIHPRESINEDDEPQLLVNLPQYNFGISGRECRGPISCRDPTTPEHKIFSCKTNYKLKIHEIFDQKKQQIVRQRVAIPSGCDCKLIDEYELKL